MNNIEWKDGVVCRAMMMQWRDYSNSKLISEHDTVLPYDGIYDINDFQLNEIRTGDYIPASELDTEQKYNDVVEVFGLSGFEKNKGSLSYGDLAVKATHYFASKDYGIDSVSTNLAFKSYCKGRKLTYSQIIAMGKLKRMMIDKVEAKLIDHQKLGGKVTSNKYEREITDRQGNSATVDVYDVLKAFEVTCPATQHAIWKLLCTGDRGHKDTLTYLSEARDAITRAIELN